MNSLDDSFEAPKKREISPDEEWANIFGNIAGFTPEEATEIVDNTIIINEAAEMDPENPDLIEATDRAEVAEGRLGELIDINVGRFHRGEM